MEKTDFDSIFSADSVYKELKEYADGERKDDGCILAWSFENELTYGVGVENGEIDIYYIPTEEVEKDEIDSDAYVYLQICKSPNWDDADELFRAAVYIFGFIEGHIAGTTIG